MRESAEGRTMFNHNRVASNPDKRVARTTLWIIVIVALVLLLAMVFGSSAQAQERQGGGADVENICHLAVFGDVATDELVGDLYEECISSSSPNGVPLEVSNRLQVEAYERLLDAGLATEGIPSDGGSNDYIAESAVSDSGRSVSEPAEKKPEVNDEEGFIRGVTLTLSASSEYLGANGAVFYDGPVAQNDIFVLFPKGFYGDIWWSTGLDNSDLWGDFDDEVDLNFGWAGSAGNFDLDIGVLYFALVEILPADVVNPYLELSREFQVGSRHALIPYGKLEYYFPVSGSDPARGFNTRLGTKHSWQVDDLLSVNSWLGVFHDTGAFGFESGVLYEGGAALVWMLENSVLTAPEVLCGHPHERLNDSREGKCVLKASWSYDF